MNVSRVTLAVFVTTVALSLLACSCEEPGTSVTFENSTNRAIWIYIDGGLVNSVIAGEAITVAESEHVWGDHLTARDENDNLIWQADITWEQLEKMGFRIVIERSSPAPEG